MREGEQERIGCGMPERAACTSEIDFVKEEVKLPCLVT